MNLWKKKGIIGLSSLFLLLPNVALAVDEGIGAPVVPAQVTNTGVANTGVATPGVEDGTAESIQDLKIQAKAAIAADSKTGQILYAQNIDQVLPIASMTKMISCAVVLDAIQNGELDWQDKVKISAPLAKLSTEPDLSNVPLKAGASYTVADLFCATIVQSANAAIMALADRVAGSQEKFVELMKSKLKDWGITDANIVTVSGLNNKYLKDFRLKGTKENDENAMSARDMAVVAQHIVNEYKDYMDVAKEPSLTFGADTENPQMMENWNEMLPGKSCYLEGVTGLKTGTTEEAGACFAGSATQKDLSIVTVVMNTENGIENKPARFLETKRLMTSVFSSYEKKTVIKKGEAVPTIHDAEVQYGKETTVPLVAKKDVTLEVPKGQEAITVKKDQNLELIAPIEKGADAVQYTVQLKKGWGYLQQKDQPIQMAVTKTADEKANFFTLLFRKVRSWFA